MASPSSVTFLFVVSPHSLPRSLQIPVNVDSQHGAWHNSTCWTSPIALLQKAGYNTRAMDLPTVGFPEQQPLADFWGDVAVVQKHLTELIASGQKVILVLHSYGGIVGTQAVEGFDVVPLEGSADGEEKGGLVQMIYLCAFVGLDGKSIGDLLGREDLPNWAAIYEPSTSAANAIPADEIVPAFWVPEPGPTFYNDMTPAAVAAATAELKPHSLSAHRARLTYAGWKTVPTTYIYCTEDQAVVFPFQKYMVEEVAKGYDFRTKTLEGSSHSPFYSRPEELVKVMLEAVTER